MIDSFHVGLVISTLSLLASRWVQVFYAELPAATIDEVERSSGWLLVFFLVAIMVRKVFLHGLEAGQN